MSTQFVRIYVSWNSQVVILSSIDRNFGNWRYLTEQRLADLREHWQGIASNWSMVKQSLVKNCILSPGRVILKEEGSYKNYLQFRRVESVFLNYLSRTVLRLQKLPFMSDFCSLSLGAQIHTCLGFLMLFCNVTVVQVVPLLWPYLYMYLFSNLLKHCPSCNSCWQSRPQDNNFCFRRASIVE